MNVVVLAAGKGVACGPSPRTDQSRCYQSEIDRDHIVTELEATPVTGDTRRRLEPRTRPDLFRGRSRRSTRYHLRHLGPQPRPATPFSKFNRTSGTRSSPSTATTSSTPPRPTPFGSATAKPVIRPSQSPAPTTRTSPASSTSPTTNSWGSKNPLHPDRVASESPRPIFRSTGKHRAARVERVLAEPHDGEEPPVRPACTGFRTARSTPTRRTSRWGTTKATRLWDRVTDDGRDATVLNVPVTFPPSSRIQRQVSGFLSPSIDAASSDDAGQAGA